MNQQVIAQNRIEQRSDTMGQQLLDQGKLTNAQAEKVLHLQRAQNLRFGEAALRLGFIQQVDIDLILASQFSYPYLPASDQSFHPQLLAAYHPFSAAVESMRSLRSQLLLRWIALGNKVVALASPNEESHGCLMAANLAIVFAQMGERTLLIDANLRKSGLGAYFGLASGPGLSEVLSHRAGMEAIQQLDRLRDLSVLCAGAPPPNPQELLSREGFSQLLDSLSEHYDVIIVDTPPINQAADALLIGARARAVLIAVEMGVTSIEALRRLRNGVQQTGAVVLGAVLQRAAGNKG